MMKRFIAMLGANATGKSTRMSEYVHTLGQPDSILDYHYHKNGEDLVIKAAGNIYGSTFVVGRPNRKGTWVGGDTTVSDLGSTVCIQDFFTHLDSIGIETVVYEAYFAASLTLFRPPKINEFFEESHVYWLLYDTVEQYVERTEARSGISWEQREKAPIDSSGWKDNVGLLSVLRRTLLQVTGSSTVQRVPIDVPKTWFIEEMKKHNLKPN